MLTVTCIQKFRDKHNIIEGYRIQAPKGETKDVTSQSLKNAIIQGKIEVTNLTLTSDNRLIDKKEHNSSNKLDNTTIDNSEKLILKLKTLGCYVGEIETSCHHKCYLASLSPESHILLIPDDVTHLNGHSSDGQEIIFTEHIQELQGTLKVFGGHNLKGARLMFYNCAVQNLDLSNFDTSNVRNMSYMFYKCEVQHLDLSKFNTSKVTNMSHMFSRCKAQHLDLSKFNTSKVTNMSHMFKDCAVQNLDLSNFDTSNVRNMSSMFQYCEVHQIDLSHFDTSNVTNMSHMFEFCETQYLDLSHFDTSNVTNMSCMFFGCKAQHLDLSHFDRSKVKDMLCMFSSCEAQLKATDQKILDEYKNRSR